MNRYKINEMLKDYKWKIASVKLMRKELEEAGGKMTAQYGPETAMPKALNQPGDPVYEEAKRREKQWERVRKFESDIKEFQALLPIIKVEREAEVLHWILEGKSQRWIGNHMGLSKTHIDRIRDSIVAQLSNVPDGTNVPNVPNVPNGTNSNEIKI